MALIFYLFSSHHSDIDAKHFFPENREAFKKFCHINIISYCFQKSGNDSAAMKL